MRDEQLIIALFIGLIILAVVIKFWRMLLGLGVVGAVIFGGLCVSGQIECPFGPRGGGGGSGGGGGGSGGTSLTEGHAIGQVRAYLARVTAPTTQRQQVPCPIRRPCRDDFTDRLKEECKKRHDYDKERKYTWETVLEWQTIQVPGPCRHLPQSGAWTATFNNLTRNWSVLNGTRGSGWHYRRNG